MKNTHQQGFTLIEMAMVVTIIGFIVGGILFGKSVLTASRLQSVITDADSYTTAVINFKQAYQALPGDFTNAAGVWGYDTSCPSGSGGLGPGNEGGGTCNGSGNGQLSNVGSAETFLFWQQLHLAGMIAQATSDCAASAAGTAGCASTAASYAATIGFNVPAGSVKGSGFSVQWWGTVGTGDSDRFPTSTDGTTTTTGPYGNVLMFGAANVSSGTNNYNYLTGSPILPADQAQQIDSKMDDGLPGSGKVRAYISTSAIAPGCTTTATASSSTYSVISGSTTSLCSLIFVMGF